MLEVDKVYHEKLKFLGLSETRKNYGVFECQCQAKTVKEINLYDVKNGKSKSCGCHRKEVNRNSDKWKDGFRQGSLEVIKRLPDRIQASGASKSLYEVLCHSCGVSKPTLGGTLNSGVESCIHCVPKGGKNNPNFRHGHASDSLERRYHLMIDRCYNERNSAYHNYGGRGITVCARWKQNNTSYFDWCEEELDKLSLTLEDGFEVDRIDNDGPYSPDNCRLVTKQANQNNKRTNVYYIDLFGFSEKITKSDARRKFAPGLNYSTLQFRLSGGWHPERALATPDSHGHRPDNYNKPLTVEEREEFLASIDML